MATKRLAVSASALRAAASQTAPRVSSRCFATASQAAPRARLQTRTVRGFFPTTTATTPRYLSVHWSFGPAAGSKLWTFEEIQTLTSSPPSPTDTSAGPARITLVDTREPGELQQSGRIPGAINIPITTAPDAFHITADEFEDRFGFARPPPDAEVVFYCKAGVRSRAAAGIAREAGWRHVGEYPGSWLDWASKGGDVER